MPSISGSVVYIMGAKLAAIFERTRIAMEAARNGGNPKWATIKVPEEVAKLLENLRQRQEEDARPFVMRDDPWSSVIQRRMERVVKFALLYAISEAFDQTPPDDLMLSLEGVKWAAKVVAFAEASHSAIRGQLVSLGQRAQEERELSGRVLSWLREKCKGGKVVRLRALSRALSLPKDAALIAVNTLIAQDRVLASGTVDGKYVPDLTEVPIRGAREVDLRLRLE
jgi:hypothetical protein